VTLPRRRVSGKRARSWAESIRIIDHALEQGVNFVDTANVYAGNESERIVGEALEAGGKRKHVVLATKFNGRRARTSTRAA
jgi:aryl-alcohol dehydrogenase-like predicted oxidoreductase